MIIEVRLTRNNIQPKINTAAAVKGLSNLNLNQLSSELELAIRAENRGGWGANKNVSVSEYPSLHLSTLPAGPAASAQATRSPAAQVVDHAKDTDLPYKLNLLPASSQLPAESAQRLQALHELYTDLHKINHAIAMTERYLPKLKNEHEYATDAMHARKAELERQLLALIEQQHLSVSSANHSPPASE